MDADRVRAQVAAMAAGGCGGFFLHPRQGMTVPYLSEAFFALVRVAVEAAAAHGLEAWLYDEFPYPSGNGGGLVTTDPALRATDPAVRRVDGCGPLTLDLPMGRLRAALAVPLREGRPDWTRAVDVREAVGTVFGDEEYWQWRLPGCPYVEDRFLAGAPRLRLAWTPPDAGAWRLWAWVDSERTEFKYFNYTVDTIAPGAAAALIACTHERYAAAVGGHFGRTIPGLFTDEIEPPAWSPHLLPGLQAQGFDPARDLPALHDDDHPEADRWRFAARRLGLDLFRERWEVPVAAWCAAHGLRWVAEKPVLTPSQLRASHIPGCDAGHVRADRRPPAPPAKLRANPRAAQAAAAQQGHGQAVVECFHSLGWGARILDQRWGFGWLGVQGASRFVPHAFYASTSGLAKHDAAPSFFLGTPAWPAWRSLADDTARWCWALAQGAEAVECAVLYPAASAWCGGPGAAGQRAALESLHARLMAAHRLWHPVDGADLRADLGVTGGALRIGACRYAALIVPPLTVAGPDEDAGIRAASAAGVPVLLLAPPPARAVGGADPAAWTSLPGVRLVADPVAALPAPVLRLAGAGADDCWATLRRSGPLTIVAVANTVGAPRRVRLAAAGCAGAWALWSTADGSSSALDGAEPVLDLPPWGTALVVHGGPSAVRSAPDAAATLPVDGWSLAPAPTLLRLDRWRIAVGGDAAPVDGPLLPARPLRWRDANAWVWRQHGDLPAPGRQPVWYVHDLDLAAAPADLALLIEVGAIRAATWQAWLDDRPLDPASARPVDLLGGARLLLPLPAAAGRRRLILRLDGVPPIGGLVQALHLHGSFGVAGDATTVVAPPVTAPLGDPHPPGWPCHGAAVTLTRTWDAGDVVQVVMPDGFREAARLEVDGVDLGWRAWPPYVWRLPPGAGPRRLACTVAGTLLPAFTGQRWDDEAGAARPL